MNSTHYTVRDVLLYDSITINVRTSGSADNNIETYNVSNVQTQIGNTMNISWTAAFFPRAGQYNVYYTYRENSTIFSVRSNGVSYGVNNQSTKYTYLTRPFTSTNIMFEIRDITLDDAGYYNGGSIAEAAWSGGGVVLVVKEKPSKPNITGDLNVEVNRYVELTCFSHSTSAPDYYSKLVNLSYTWFVNETKMDGETRENLRIYVTIDLKYNKYSCRATDDNLECDPLQINSLYKYDRLTISPEPELNEDNKIAVREGDIIGPFNCSADCNPRCDITWKLKSTSGYSDPPQKDGLLLALVVERDMEFVRCVAQWIHTNKTIQKEILLDVQYSPQTPINFTGYSFTNNCVNLTWISGFNGGNDQFFIVHLKDSSTWRELTNVTYQMEGRKVQFDHGPLTPGREYWFRLKSCNTINCSSTPADVRAVVKGELCAQYKGNQEKATPTDVLVGICILLTVFGIACLIVAVLVIFKTRRGNDDRYDDHDVELDEEHMTQHYVYVQDSSEDDDAGVQVIGVEMDYTVMHSRSEQETPYEELNSI
nr:uncharacterized protein LOC105319714 [Crassostrea gigas]